MSIWDPRFDEFEPIEALRRDPPLATPGVFTPQDTDHVGLTDRRPFFRVRLPCAAPPTNSAASTTPCATGSSAPVRSSWSRPTTLPAPRRATVPEARCCVMPFRRPPARRRAPGVPNVREGSAGGQAAELEPVAVLALTELLAAPAQVLLARLALLERDIERDERGARRGGQRHREVDVVLLRPRAHAAERLQRAHQGVAVCCVDRIPRCRHRLAHLVAGRAGGGADQQERVRLIEADAHSERAGAVGGPICIACRVAVGADLG